MTLWCMAKSPLMFGGDATLLDAFTTSLLTNPTALKINSASYMNKEVTRTDGSHAVWVAKNGDSQQQQQQQVEQQPAIYAALFSLANQTATVEISMADLGLDRYTVSECHMHDVWRDAAHQQQAPGKVQATLDPYGVALLRLTACK